MRFWERRGFRNSLVWWPCFLGQSICGSASAKTPRRRYPKGISRRGESAWRKATASALLDFLHFRVDHIVVRGPGRRSFRRAGAAAFTATGRLRGLLRLHVGVHFLAQFLAHGHERVGLFLDGGLVLALECFFHVFHRGL